MQKRIRRKPRLLASLAFIVFLFSMLKVWTAFSMSNILVVEGISVSAKSDTVDEGVVSIAGNKILANAVKFHQVGDYITYSVKIKNDKDEDYVLKSITDDNKNEYVSYSYDDYKNVKLKSGESIDFVFTETYSTEVEDIEKRNQGFSVNFYMVLEPEKKHHDDDNDDTDNTKEDTTEEKINFNRNPATGDHIELYILLAIISLAFSVFVLKKTGTKKMNKTGLRLLILFMALYTAFIPQMAKSIDGQSFKMVLENNIQLKDKLLVSYDVDGVVNTITIPYDTKVSIDDPQKEGYTFKGWQTDDGEWFDMDTLIKDDINLTAVFEADSYQISYELHGGQAENPSIYTIEDEVHITDPKKPGYDFTGWTGTDLTELTKNLVIPRGSMGDRAYEAHWIEKQYTVVFNANGGSGDMASATFTYGTADYLPANEFTKTDNRFREWNTKADGSGTSYSDQAYVKNLTTEDEITLYAQWTPASNWAMFKDGPFVNKTMKQLAGNSGANYNTTDNKIVSIERSATPAPEGVTTASVKSTYSPSPLDMWYDSTSHTIYYYSPATYIYLNPDSKNMFGDFAALTNIDYNGFLTDEVTDMSSMFSQATALQEINLSGFNTAKVTNMQHMFNSCKSATVINVSSFDTRNVEDMNHMFTSCEKITDLDLSRFNTSKVKNMQKMFDYLPLVESIEVNHFDTSQVTDMWGMFRDCPNLKSLDISNFDTGNVTDMTEMFGCQWPLRVDHAGVASITIGPKFNTSKVTSMKRMFYLCTNLKSFNLKRDIDQNVFFGFDTRSVTDMEGMFSDCTSLTVMDLSSFDTGNVTRMPKMFKGMTNLVTIYASDDFVVQSAASNNNMFDGDVKLEGGGGTTYAAAQVKGSGYARIDNPPSNPGYFTSKA